MSLNLHLKRIVNEEAFFIFSILFVLHLHYLCTQIAHLYKNKKEYELRLFPNRV